MKKCPNCQKEFPDTMRFCQTDGTPLDTVGETQADDPLKTTVVRQEDISSAIPPSDPFKTIIAGSTGLSDREDESDDDLLQLPQEFDPMKTMVVTPLPKDRRDAPKFEDIRDEIKLETPPSSSPFGGFSQPKEPLPEAPKDYSNDPTLMQPESPSFNKPSPPNFGGSSMKDEEDLQQTLMQGPWGSAPKSDDSPYSNDSPFAKPSDEPMASPFDLPRSPFDEPKSATNENQSPFGQPSSFDTPKDSGFNQAPSSFENQPASFNQPKTSFDEPASNQFGSAQSQFDQMNQGFGAPNQQVQQGGWAPSSPEQGWGEQGLGGNAPFQPSAAGAGQSKTLAIISLVTGGLSVLLLGGLIIPFLNIVCMFLAPGLGLAGVITGFLARIRAKRDPEQYGGSGLALGGIITGALSILAVVGLFVLAIILGLSGGFRF
jgi:hypothetical protein